MVAYQRRVTGWGTRVTPAERFSETLDKATPATVI
jgi:hypothetical protein